jgi:hypothetical protein
MSKSSASGCYNYEIKSLLNLLKNHKAKKVQFYMKDSLSSSDSSLYVQIMVPGGRVRTQGGKPFSIVFILIKNL